MMFRYVVLTCLGLCLGGTVFAQAAADITGSWYGIFKTPQGQLQRLVLSFEKEGNGWKGEMESPDITDYTIVMDTVTLKGDTLRFSIHAIGLSFTGALTSRSTYDGNFEQLGNKVSIHFSRKEIKEEELTAERPQTPKPPFAYDIEEVKFVNPIDKIILGGTLTLPAKKSEAPFPVIVLIPGAGPHDRDNEMWGHRPFAVMADYFVRRGIATLRLDDRGMGTSTGNYDSSTIGNFANDVQAALDFLRKRQDIDSVAIGLLGYSEGGAVAQMVAANDKMVAFLILMGAPGLDGKSGYTARMTNTAAAFGEKQANIRDYTDYYQPYLNTLATQKDAASRKNIAYNYLSAIYNHFVDSLNVQGKQQFITATYEADTKPVALSLLKFDPAPYLARIKCPVLAVNGEKDMQTDALSNLKAIETGLEKGGNDLLTIRNFDGLNHLFQHCNTCRVEEYGTLDETINPAVLEFMTRWVQLLY